MDRDTEATGDAGTNEVYVSGDAEYVVISSWRYNDEDYVQVWTPGRNVTEVFPRSHFEDEDDDDGDNV